MDKMVLNKDREIRRKGFGRSISFQKHLPVSSSVQKRRTVTPSLFPSLKGTRGTMLQRSIHVDSEESSSSAVDDIIFLDSFVKTCSKEDVNVIVSRDVNVIVSRDGIKQSLMNLMKSQSGNVKLLNDLEMGTFDHQNIEEGFRNADYFEKNVAFLWAVLLERKDLLEFFCKGNVHLNFTEPQQGFSALHLSSLCGYKDCTKYLINMGADVNILSLEGYFTPLHCAAFGNFPHIAEVLLEAGAKIEIGNETPVHSAVRSKAVGCLRLFVKECFDLNLGECGFTPLHLAADLGYVECLEALLDSGKCDIDVETCVRRNTALHLAAENGYVECVKVLLSKNANPNALNHRKETPLHAAAKVCLESVKLLLTSGADPDKVDVDWRTPVHAAVCNSECEHSLDIIQCLSQKGGEEAVNKQDKYGYTPLHIAALNELNECVEYLILQGSDVTARTKGGTTALSIISRKTPAALTAVEQKLDECITADDHDASSKEIGLHFSFRYLLQNCKGGEISFLQTFVEEGQKEILGHPLCEAFLHLKWQKIRKYYIARLIFCSLYVLLLSMYALTALAYQCYNDSVSDAHPDAQARILIVDPELCTKKSYFGDFLRRNPIIMEMEWFLLAFMTVLEIFRKVYGFRGYKSVRHYVSQRGNLVEWFVVLSVFLISFVYTGRTYIWQNHVGALAVLCGWANLMIMIGNLPIFGSYVTMYTKVQKEFTKLFLVYSCLLIGFTICFCVIFPKVKQFSNPLVAVIKILVMMTGELEFDSLVENIREKDSNSAALMEASALTTFVFFLIFVTIILMNLLVGIAVHDIQGLQKTAVLSKLVGQTKLITHLESALFSKHPWCLPKSFLKVLQTTAFVSPSSYRVVVEVKPLNPRESRLPKEVMRSALEIAKQKKPKGAISARSSMRCTISRKRKLDEIDFGELQSSLKKLFTEIETLKQILKEKTNS